MRRERSLRVLRNKEMGGGEVVNKSGLVVGVGETHEEMVVAFGQLRDQGVQVLTVGQYLRRTERHPPVVRYWHPDEFKAPQAGPPTTSASNTTPPARWCAPATTPTSTSPMSGPESGPLVAA